MASRLPVQKGQKILLVESVAIVRQGERRITGGGAVGGAKCLGSGLVLDHSQNKTVAARRMAEKNVCGQRS